VYEPGAADELAEVELEARLLAVPAAADAPPLRLDARDVVRALTARSMGHVLAAGEVLLLHVGEHALRLRVSQADVLDATARVRWLGTALQLRRACC
jgi:hypothetical protein